MSMGRRGAGKTAVGGPPQAGRTTTSVNAIVIMEVMLVLYIHQTQYRSGVQRFPSRSQDPRNLE